MTAWLLTWLWQGFALTAIMSTAFRLVRWLNAATRYWMRWGTLAGVAWLGFISFPGSPGVHDPASVPAVGGFAAQLVFHVPAAPETLIATLLGIWAAIALLSLVRVLPAVRAIHGLRDRCRRFPDQIESELPLWLEARSSGRKSRLMLCDSVAGATVLGFHQPFIAVPASLLSALSRAELDQIVLHEYAHVQRWDDWGRLGQLLLQSALWIHPAVALIGQGLNLDREMSCDDWVVARTGLPKAFAHCLTRAAEIRSRIRLEPVLSPALFGRRRELVRRVDRLLAVTGRTRRKASVIALACAGCWLIAATAHLRSAPLIAELVGGTLPGVAAPEFQLAVGPIRRVVAEIPDIASLSAVPGMPAMRQPHQEREGVSTPVVIDRPRDDRFGAEAARTSGQADPASEFPPQPIAARTFDGRYLSKPAISAAASQTATPWQLAGAAGGQVGAVAKKTSVGIARTFTRAGVSVARSF